MRRLGATVLAGALLIGGAACAASDDDDGASTEGSGAGEAAVDDTATTEAETTTTTTEATTTTLRPEDDLANAEVEEYVTTEHPDVAALVDWSIFSWAYGYGHTATVPAGTTVDDAVAACEAISEIVYTTTALGRVEVVDTAATTLALREGPDGACAAA